MQNGNHSPDLRSNHSVQGLKISQKMKSAVPSKKSCHDIMLRQQWQCWAHDQCPPRVMACDKLLVSRYYYQVCSSPAHLQHQHDDPAWYDDNGYLQITRFKIHCTDNRFNLTPAETQLAILDVLHQGFTVDQSMLESAMTTVLTDIDIFIYQKYFVARLNIDIWVCYKLLFDRRWFECCRVTSRSHFGSWVNKTIKCHWYNSPQNILCLWLTFNNQHDNNSSVGEERKVSDQEILTIIFGLC